MDAGIVILRIAVGLTLAAHGAQKLFGWFGGPGLAKTAAGMEQLGFVPGRRNALLAGLGEAGGGLLLALGLGTPAAAAIVVAVMIVAGVSAHWKQGFFVQNHGYEYTLVLALGAASVAFTGAGSLSLDALIGWRLGGWSWGLVAVAAGAVGAAGSLLARRGALAARQGHGDAA
jgi:putative oxidoreductase